MDILDRAKANKVPHEFSTKKVSKVLELYTLWYDGDAAAAKVALIQDILEFNTLTTGEEEAGYFSYAGVLQAVIQANG